MLQVHMDARAWDVASVNERTSHRAASRAVGRAPSAVRDRPREGQSGFSPLAFADGGVKTTEKFMQWLAERSVDASSQCCMHFCDMFKRIVSQQLQTWTLDGWKLGHHQAESDL